MHLFHLEVGECSLNLHWRCSALFCKGLCACTGAFVALHCFLRGMNSQLTKSSSATLDYGLELMERSPSGLVQSSFPTVDPEEQKILEELEASKTSFQ